MSNFQKIAPGDFVGVRTNADFHNALVDCLEDVDALKKAAGQKNLAAVDPSVVLIQNATGADLDAFNVVKLDEALYSRSSADFFKKGLNYGCEIKAHKPTGTTSEIVGITRGAIKAGGIGWATVSGATLVKYSGNSGDYLKPVNNDVTKMERSTEGGQGKIICTSNTTSAGGDAYVLLNAPAGGGGGGCSCDEPVFACLEDDLYADDYTTAKVWPDFTEEIEVWASPLMCDEDSIEKCTMVLCHKIDGDWYALIEGGKCNCECQEYPPGSYQLYARWGADSYDRCTASGCTQGVYAIPNILQLKAVSAETQNPPGDTASWLSLGVVASYNDLNTCVAALQALDKNSALITTLVPVNDNSYIYNFMAAGKKADMMPQDEPKLTADQVKACQAEINYLGDNIDCNTCQPLTCSECNQQKTPGALHNQIEVRVSYSDAGTTYSVKTFVVCREWYLGELTECCPNSDCCD